MQTTVSGIGRVMNVFAGLVIEGQVLSLVIALVLVVLVSVVLFRSPVLGLITAVPVVLATIVNFGFLGWWGIALGVTTAMCSSVGIGIGVDFAIHFVSRYSRALAQGEGPDQALATTVGSAGTAILYNAVVVIAGFLVLVASGFMPNRTFGWLVSLAMFVCVLATLTTMAALLLMWARRAAPR
jgi:predicted RND superfamily exporter protein